ncbi:MAG TPA: uracil-DNA glycosylase [Candidatus Azoamicus sp. MARI]
MFEYIDKSWHSKLSNEFKKEYIKDLITFIKNERKKKYIFPKEEDVVNALRFTKLNEVKVVILGQDPYCFENQANGFAFSVQDGEKLPPSLKNIYIELYNDLGIPISNNGCLINWSKQGILLLNTILTVEKGKPGSHANIGWEILTDFIIKIISNMHNRTIFVLWGKHALSKKYILNNKNDILIHSSHPSSFSAEKGFFSSRPFSKINMHLKLIGKTEINWAIV